MIEDVELTKTASVVSFDSDGLGPDSSSSVSSPSRAGMCMSVRLSILVCICLRACPTLPSTGLSARHECDAGRVA